MKTNRGISILGMLFLGVILILILSYFNISLKAVVESPTAKDNIGYVTGSSENLWTKYLQKPASYFWNEVWIKIFWASFISDMKNIRDNKPTSIQQLAPTVNTQ